MCYSKSDYYFTLGKLIKTLQNALQSAHPKQNLQEYHMKWLNYIQSHLISLNVYEYMWK